MHIPPFPATLPNATGNGFAVLSGDLCVSDSDAGAPSSWQIFADIMTHKRALKASGMLPLNECFYLFWFVFCRFHRLHRAGRAAPAHFPNPSPICSLFPQSTPISAKANQERHVVLETTAECRSSTWQLGLFTFSCGPHCQRTGHALRELSENPSRGADLSGGWEPLDTGTSFSGALPPRGGSAVEVKPEAPGVGQHKIGELHLSRGVPPPDSPPRRPEPGIQAPV